MCINVCVAAAWDEFCARGEWNHETTTMVAGDGHGPAQHRGGAGAPPRLVEEAAVVDVAANTPTTLSPVGGLMPPVVFAPVNGEAHAAPLVSALIPRKTSNVSLDAWHPDRFPTSLAHFEFHKADPPPVAFSHTFVTRWHPLSSRCCCSVEQETVGKPNSVVTVSPNGSDAVCRFTSTSLLPLSAWMQ